jgi:hypothetical protein
MAPKKDTRGEKPKRQVVIFTIEMKKKLVGPGCSVSHLLLLLINYYTIFLCIYY